MSRRATTIVVSDDDGTTLAAWVRGASTEQRLWHKTVVYSKRLHHRYSDLKER